MNLPIGFQAYEIIADLNKDWVGTLKKMSGFGYKHIDMVMTGPYAARTAKDLKAIARTKPASAVTTATGVTRTSTRRYGPTITYSQALGVKSVVCGPRPRRKTADDWKFQADELNKFGAMTAEGRVVHRVPQPRDRVSKTPEGQVPYDILMANTDPKLVRFQIDVGNLTFGAGNAYAYLAKYPTRYFSVHAKDFTPGKAAVPVGSGSSTGERSSRSPRPPAFASIVSEVGAYNASTLSGSARTAGHATSSRCSV